MAPNKFDDRASSIKRSPVSSLIVRRTRSATAAVHETVLEFISNGRNMVIVLNKQEAKQLRDWLSNNILKG